MSNEQPDRNIEITGSGNVVGNDSRSQVVKVEGGSTTGPIVAGDYHYYAAEASIRPIPWLELKLTCQKNSKYHLDLLREKYNRELYVERKVLRWHVERFLSSDDAHYLVLNGQSGMGKTGFLCRLEEDFRERDDIACLVYDCGALIEVADEARNVSLMDCLAQGILPKPDDRALNILLDRIEVADGFGEQQLVIIVDAINENKNMDAIIRMLADLQRSRLRSWIKVIVSCRPHAWPLVSEKMMLPRTMGGPRIPSSYFYKPPNVDEWYVEVTAFSGEEAEEAYQKYQERYQLQPERFGELEPVLQARLREPLLLWLVSEIRTGNRITIEVAGSDISVIPSYTGQLLRRLGLGEENRKKATRFLKETLPKLMVVNHTCYNTVPRDKIPPGSSTRLGQFLEAGMLEETADGQVRFRFERFYDFYFGLHLHNLFKKDKSKEDKLKEDKKLGCQPIAD
jgi:hypothetical protein